MSPYKVLVIGDDTRSFLTTVRSLGMQNIEVHAAPYNMRAPALGSKYISQIHRLPYYLNGGSDWLQAIRKLISEKRYDFIVPCEERSLLPLYKHHLDLPKGPILAIPDKRALDAFFDKLNTRKLASELDVPIAKGRAVSADDTVERVLSELNLPLVAKQRRSYSWPELYVRTSVQFIENKSQFESILPTLLQDYEDYFLEEVFDGKGIGVSVLCSKGRIIQAFEHHRAHEQSGSSYYRKSAPLNDRRLAAVGRMVKAVEYTGLAMFEFKLNAKDEEDWILLEVNARPWGSIPLPVSIGIDFPYLLFKLMVLNEECQPAKYRSGMYARNMLPDLWQLRTFISRRSDGILTKVLFSLKWIFSFLRPILGLERHDVFKWFDFNPAWLELKQFIDDRRGALHQRSSALTRILGLMNSKQDLINISFICQGNICRSPYAEKRARAIFSKYKNTFSFNSAGMLPRNPRRSPSEAISAAAARNVQLSDHLSRHADENFVDSTDLFFVFDTKNYRHFRDRYPERLGDVYILTDAVTTNKVFNVIDDPDGLGIGAFQKSYSEIDQILEEFLNALESSSQYSSSPKI